LWTLCWREMDSNFQYAGAVNLAVAPFMPPNARDGSVRPLSFRTARRLVSKRRGPDRRGRNPCRRRTAPNFAWSGNGNALPGDRARRSRPGARQPLGWSEGATAGPPSSPSGNPIWSVADIDPLHGVFGERAANRGWGPWFLRNLALRRHHPICLGEHFPGHRPEAHRETRPTA